MQQCKRKRERKEKKEARRKKRKEEGEDLFVGKPTTAPHSLCPYAHVMFSQFDFSREVEDEKIRVGNRESTEQRTSQL